MQNMMVDYLYDLLKILLPAALVLYGMYALVNNYLTKEAQKRVLDLRMKNTEVVLPIRLQAYERVCLLLERLSPSNMLVRVSSAGQSAADYQRALLAEIRNEFNHNVSQQIYMSDQAWLMVKRAKEDIVTLINQVYQELPENAKGSDLAKKVLERVLATEVEPAARAISFLKQEINQVF
jgi:diphthamide synthase (EF-2-diphthine--ammonia ligase)